MNLKKTALKVVLSLCLVLSLSVAGWAARPEEALSARPEKSLYAVLHLDDLGGTLRYLFSEENLKVIAPAAELDEESIQLFVAALEKVPARSAALLLGMTDPNGMPFFQAALDLPADLKSRLDLVADGKATASDLTTLLLGPDNPVAVMAGAALEVTPQEGGLLVNDVLYLTARDNLLLLALFSPNDLKAGVAALDNPKEALSMKRRFKAKDFAFLHFDPALLADLVKEQAQESGGKVDETAYKTLKDSFRAPVEVEMGFEGFADKFLVSMAVNAKEALSKELADKMGRRTSAPGGHLLLMGKESPLLALSSAVSFVPDDYAKYPGFPEVWKEASDAVKGLGLAEADLVNLLNGSFSLVVNGTVPFESMKVPGAYLALTGRDGAAGKFFGLANKGELPLSPVSVTGWEMLQVDPSIAPVPALLGRRDETIFCGIQDAGSLAENPSPSTSFQEFQKQESFGGFFIDFAGIQSFLKDGSNGVLPFLLSMAGDDANIKKITEQVLDAKFSIPSMSVWIPTEETLFTQFDLADVPVDDGLWAKLVRIYLDIQAGAYK